MKALKRIKAILFSVALLAILLCGCDSNPYPDINRSYDGLNVSSCITSEDTFVVEPVMGEDDSSCENSMADAEEWESRSRYKNTFRRKVRHSLPLQPTLFAANT